MPREIPDFPKDWKKPSPAGGRAYDIELITPMFGGGAETRINDPSFPIRATAIKGQLQFWWRATVGAQYATRQELRAAQSEVWGSTEHASRVQVLVENGRADEPEPCALIEWDQQARRGQGGWRINWQSPFDLGNSALPYALFPFQGEMPRPNRNATVTAPPAACVRQAVFRLILRCPDELWPQVEAAVWAWVNLGGLGSRTRRGCGAVRCKEFAPKDAADLVTKWKQDMPDLFPEREWPTLAAGILVGSEQPDAMTAWERVIGVLRHFRQGVGVGRNPGQHSNQPGRSRFPEPETIRTVLWNPDRPWRHGRLEDIPNDAFPRAELGLPIVFHFQGQGEPPDTVLYPSNNSNGERRERMASPLILKPLSLANGKVAPLILRLKTPDLVGVDLRQKVQGQEQSVPLANPTQIRAASLATYTNSPLAASPNGSALEAFLAYALTQGFTEVTR